ncbi:hypothetical protein CH276_22665 [Rhodococcus sp. 06-470-2]|uniref:hypothetical protein n=1 Tax=unclassified Rhodococcus (in: high G+C Gram-positive bacteria) TaxID=192944 RepID=UPI000B9B9FB3|nr:MULTISPECIES: hypothetical protein [unclassified Rhodococcus (in: high G+C Gram-positive bacteria)]OZC59253.1 hypothetical protein CH276_22665 [Rhodococcus sp. 06-470-2]OZE66840.1 hypothetical protein CH265_07990 [Rhodococcus sp. 05-2221-1B]
MTENSEQDADTLRAQAEKSNRALAEAKRLADFHTSMLTDPTPWTVFALGGGQNLWGGPILSILRRLAAQMNDNLEPDGFRIAITLEQFEKHIGGSETVNFTKEVRGRWDGLGDQFGEQAAF